MSDQHIWMSEGIEAHVNAVLAERFGYRPPAQRTEQETKERLTPGDVSRTEETATEAPCGEVTMEFTWHQGAAAEGARRLRIEFPAESSSEIVVKFGPVGAARG